MACELLKVAQHQVKGTDLVRSLLERSEQNRDKNRRELQDKYCFRHVCIAGLACNIFLPAIDVATAYLNCHCLAFVGRQRMAWVTALVSG